MKKLESECEELRNLNDVEDNKYQQVLVNFEFKFFANSIILLESC